MLSYLVMLNEITFTVWLRIFIRHFISLVRTLTKKYRHNKRNNIISQQKCALSSLINKNVQIKRPQFFGIYSAKEKDE